LRPAIFLDRDGTILEEMGYLNHISRFRMLSGVAAAIRGLNPAQLPVVVVTNQSGVARGWMACIIARMSALTNAIAVSRKRACWSAQHQS